MHFRIDFPDFGGVREKRCEIDRHVLEQFRDSRRRMKQVHDRDIISWAMHKAEEIHYNDFKASSHWIFDWKKTHQIVKRKINKRFTRKEIDDEPQVQQSIDEFVSKIRSSISCENPPILFNADEAGYACELKFDYTLECKGTRYIKEKIDSKNATTHSYTSLPLVSQTGDFVLPHLIILQEVGGKFGPQVERRMFQHPDLLIMCSKSGKMTKFILGEWYEKVVFASRELHNNILLFDSFGMHKDELLMDEHKPHNFDLRVEFIPKGTTGHIQPLDRDLNRTFKEMVRNLSGLYCSDADPRIQRKAVHIRDNICLIQLLMYNQCSSPRFKGWIQRSFNICGYTDSHEPYIKSPTGYCFGTDVSRSNCDNCMAEGDPRMAKIRCGWCKHFFCAFHFFFEEHFFNPPYHYCKRYIPDD